MAKLQTPANIPFVEKGFESRKEAILYTFERQAARRSSTMAEILAAADLIKGRKETDYIPEVF
jgi:hypothetical protein